MDMNIGSLMRALMKDSQPADAKALELRIGQIVRGVLIEMLDAQEGLININGVPVRAKLEAEMAVGQGTLLQVRQESSSGMISLKPLGDAAAGAQGDEGPIKEGAKAFGMPDQPWSRELLRGLARDGYPVTKETADWFKQAAEAMPQGADAKAWMNAAGVAFRRGLQPTETTIGSLRQALYGPPLHEQLASLAELADRSAADGAAKPAVAAAAQRVGQLLREVSALIAGSTDGSAARGAAGHSEGAGGGPGAARPELGGMAEGRTRPMGSERREDGLAGRVNAGRADAGSGAAGGVLPGAGTAARGGAEGAPIAASAGRDALTADSAGTANSREATAGKPGAVSRPGAPSVANEQQAARDVAGSTPAEGRSGGEPWIGKLLNALGANHEHMALKSGVWSELQGAAGQTPGSPADGGIAPAAQQADSLKSALLGLTAMEDAPQALREAAQNLLQQITGQQLLLSAERQNTAMMSHMTLFIPMKGQDGETTAKVHIEARRGRRGELDADNCRLLFDLEMRHMGRTVVDVQVVDKSVSLRLLNDRPEVAELIEGARDEAAEGLRSAGYRLMSLTAVPYPARTPGDEGAGDAGAGAAAGSAYAAKPYKGIDYRA